MKYKIFIKCGINHLKLICRIVFFFQLIYDHFILYFKEDFIGLVHHESRLLICHHVKSNMLQCINSQEHVVVSGVWDS